jgi:predicted benzoate:H+ symporter BenE
VATALGVFFAVAIPVVVVGYTRPGGASVTIIAIGIAAGLLAAVLAGIWVNQRDGRVWRDPRL